MTKKPAIPPKKERLTLTQLTDYDDILTDALVDHVHFGDKIRKTTGKKYSSKRMSQDDIHGIILQEIICNKDYQAGETRLLKIPALAAFVGSLQPHERDHFKRHLRKYINIWSTDSPFEVTTTNRYTIVSYEAAVTARRAIRTGETIKYLCGTLVAITPEEEQALDISSRDFSIVMSSRKKRPSLFLGPARFANHDCDANAKLVTVGPDTMEVVAVRRIAPNEEITVTYGDDYFGVKNCECLCQTCEMAVRGGWIAGHKLASSWQLHVDDSETSTYRFRNKRRRDDSSCDGLTPEAEDFRAEKRRKLIKEPAPKGLPPPADPLLIVKRPRGRPPKRPKTVAQISAQQTDSLVPQIKPTMVSSGTQTTEMGYTSVSTQMPSEPEKEGDPVQEAIIDQHTCHSVESPTALKTEPAPAEHQIKFDESTDRHAPAFDVDDHLLVAPEMDRERPSLQSSLSNEPESIFERDQDRVSSPASTPRAMAKDEMPVISSLMTETATPNASDITAEVDPTPPSLEQLTTRPPSMPVESIPKAKTPDLLNGTQLDEEEILAQVSSPRRPGDYIRPAFFVSQPAAIWAVCQTCGGHFAQQDGYTIRKECPRCERHSIVYGFQWPKTENAEGENATRIMDHRIVHRFLGVKQMSRVRRGLSAIGSDGETSSEEEGGGRRKKSGRVKWCY